MYGLMWSMFFMCYNCFINHLIMIMQSCNSVCGCLGCLAGLWMLQQFLDDDVCGLPGNQGCYLIFHVTICNLQAHTCSAG